MIRKRIKLRHLQRLVVKLMQTVDEAFFSIFVAESCSFAL